MGDKFVIHCDIWSRSRNYFIVEVPEGLSSDNFVAFNEFGAAVDYVLKHSVSDFMLRVFTKDPASHVYRERLLAVAVS